jgi:hypothetical protein
MKYALVQYDNPEGFVKAVQDGLDKGWRCQGGVAVIDQGIIAGKRVLGYAQAMVKED